MKADRLQELGRRLPGWERVEEPPAITRTYRFPTFRAAVAFVAWVAELAEAADHHPDIDVRFDRVTLTLTTHSAGRLTERDFELAARIDHREWEGTEGS